MVRSIDVKLLTENIKEMCIQANHYLAAGYGQGNEKCL